MNCIKNILNYLNPIPTTKRLWNDDNIHPITKIAISAFSAFVGLFTFGLGGLSTFQLIVNCVSRTPPEHKEETTKAVKETAKKKLNPAGDNHSGQRTTQTLFRQGPKKAHYDCEHEYKFENTVLKTVAGDLLEQPVRAIINPANERLLGGGGLDGTIHRAAGSQLLSWGRGLPLLPGHRTDRIQMGDAKTSPSYEIGKKNPHIKNIIHAVGPREDTPNRQSVLKETYLQALHEARKMGIRSVAFPAISVGIFHYPFEEAQSIAFEAVREFVLEYPDLLDEILFVYRPSDIAKNRYRWSDQINRAWQEKILKENVSSLTSEDKAEKTTDVGNFSAASSPFIDPDDPKELLAFYQGSHKNKNGFSLEEILAFDDEEMERHHDFIQWIFPTKNNGVNPQAPELHPALTEKALGNRVFKENMLRSFKKMLSYYGLEMQGANVVKAPNFQERKKYWVINDCHNLKRMTRIIESMKELGLREQSTSFANCILNIAQSKEVQISEETKGHWRNAMR